ncbi:heme oxygenase 1 [Spea bombifrons]|uniref:heme oxygenase 1 n=1 Tax=Spea bombifrons TaxID=233779 RepID=UPI0023499847|nr:heme oxygenase 1 [Spea bombifrons]
MKYISRERGNINYNGSSFSPARKKRNKGGDMDTGMDQKHNSTKELSEALKEATKEVHEEAENTALMKKFQKGLVSLNEFKLVMSSLYFVYEALEEEIDRNKENSVFAPLYFPLELHRKYALEQDLEYLYGPQWKNKILCPQSTKNYVNRIYHVGQKQPELLVAHAYTRYLGDLSGGQVLKKIAQKTLQLPATGEGLAFFTFDHVSSATKFKQLYRSRMNSIEMDIGTKQRVLEEAKTAFLLNVKVFEELQNLSEYMKTEISMLRNRVPNRVNGDFGIMTQSSEPKISKQRNSMLFLRWTVIAGLALVTFVGLYLL